MVEFHVASGATRPTGDRRITYLPFLDGVRALAVLMVIGVHFPFMAGIGATKALWSVDRAIRGGYVGVDLFFVLSGFLITRILLRQRIRQGSFSFLAFYGRRALRIFPIYYLAICACALIFTMQPEELVSLLLYSFNYFQPFHDSPHPLQHTWSLAVEEQFYIFWPLLVASVRLRWGQAVTGAVVPLLALGAAMLIASVLHGQLASDLIFMSTPTRMMSLSLGAFLAFREQQERPLPVWAGLAAAAAGILLLSAEHAARTRGLIDTGGWYWVVATVGYALSSVGFLSTLVFGRGPLVRAAHAVLAWKPLRYVGRISYGLYLYHLIVLFALGIDEATIGYDGAPPRVVLLAAVLTVTIAVASFYLIELPLLRLKDRLRRTPAGFVTFGPSRRASPGDWA